MEITIDELLAGKATYCKKKEFLPTAAYVEPFLERTNALVDHYNINVVLPDQYTKSEEDGIDIKDITYNRVWVEGVLKPEFDFHEHQGVIGMVYGIDIRKPVAKFYKGAIRSACTNLCVFNPELLRLQELESNTTIDFKGLKEIIEYTDDTRSWIDRLRSTPFEKKDLNESLGRWIRKSIDLDFNNGFGKVKLSPSDVISAYKDLFVDTKSDYYVELDSETTMFNIYNALTQQITDNKRDITQRVEKTLIIKDILDLY